MNFLTTISVKKMTKILKDCILIHCSFFQYLSTKSFHYFQFVFHVLTKNLTHLFNHFLNPPKFNTLKIIEILISKIFFQIVHWKELNLICTYIPFKLFTVGLMADKTRLYYDDMKNFHTGKI